MAGVAPSYKDHRPENSPESHIVVGAPSLSLVTDRGDPIPPSEIVAELAAISPRYKLEWLNSAWGTSCFVLKTRWAENDRRWQRVQQGELPEHMAFDIEFRFPLGMSHDDMLGYVRSRHGDRGYVKDPVKEAERAVERAKQRLIDAQNAAVDSTIEQGTQRILDESNHLREVRAGVSGAHTMIQGADLVPDREPKRLL